MKTSYYLLFTCCLAIAAFSCKKEDEGCGITYEKHIKSIIDNSCAYSGCHSGSTASAWVPEGSKDYTSYDGLLNNLENGKFETRTLTQANMPPNTPPASNFIPEGRPKSLTEEEVEMLNCWMENGYPRS